MGILDKLAGKRGLQEESETRAYIEAMIMMIAADGVIEEDEVQDFMKFIYSKQQFRSHSSQEIISIIKRSFVALEKEGIDSRIRAISAMLNSIDKRIDAFRMCLSICASDGDVAPEELEILKKMQKEFDLSEAQVDKIMNEDND